MNKLAEKYSERAQILAKAFLTPILATFATLTIMRPASFEFPAVFCKQSPVY